MAETQFVARERELTYLNASLECALAGQGKICFITGDAGSGKTALVEEFSHRAQQSHPDLLVAVGKCNAQTGLGDPYLPFREVLSLLFGDVEEKLAQKAISPENANRLQDFLNHSGGVLIEMTPHLIGALIPGAKLMAILGKAVAKEFGWIDDLKRLILNKEERPPQPVVNQQYIFEEYAKALTVLAERKPLIIILDDLQWADTASISLLFHLGRQMTQSHVLFIGCYRPGDVGLGRGGERHPLESVVNELQRYYGNITIDLNATTKQEGRQFVDAILDNEPNNLGEAFRSKLFKRTGGHALFTIELLRDMEAKGYLEHNETGKWIEGSLLDWDALPSKVESVIQERFARLDEFLREALTIASVEGIDFTAEVITEVQSVDLRKLVRRLSREAGQIHHLVRELGVRHIDEKRVSLYYFWHNIFQDYLYNQIGAVERVYLHEDVGRSLEALYGNQVEQVALQLAWHFEQAGVAQKAIDYLRMAGNQAIMLSANEEAKGHFSRGLVLLRTLLPDSPERTALELELQLPLAIALMNLKGYSDPEVGKAFARAHELCNQIGETPRVAAALHGLGAFYCAKAEYNTAVKLAKRILRIAPKAENPSFLLLIGHNGQTANLSLLGESKQALLHAEKVLEIYDPQKHSSLLFLLGLDIKTAGMSYKGMDLWLQGYPNKALEISRDTLTLVRNLNHQNSMVFAFYFSNMLYHFCRDIKSLQELTEEWLTLSTKYGYQMWIGIAKIFRGWSQVEKGNSKEGIVEMSQGFEIYMTTGASAFNSYYLCMLAEAYGRAGQTNEGLSALDKSLEYVAKTGEHFYEAEIYRLKGELLLTQGADEASVEENYDIAIGIARQQCAKSLELRAVMSLCRLWQKQGKQDEGLQMLNEIYSKFNEGFDTGDLQEAKALIEKLAINSTRVL